MYGLTNQQLPQQLLQREAMPPPHGPTWATDPFCLCWPAKSVAAGDKKKKVFFEKTKKLLWGHI